MKQLISNIGSLYCYSSDRLFEREEIFDLIQKKERAYQIQGISDLKVSLISTSDIHFVTSLFALMLQNCSVLLLSPELSPAEKLSLNSLFASSYELTGESSSDLLCRTQMTTAGFYLTTSGTTGTPKLISCSIENLVDKINFLTQKIPLDEIKVSASVLSLSFGHGLIGTLLLPLLTGNRVILVGTALDRLLRGLEILKTHQVTFLSATPHIFQIMGHDQKTCIPSLLRVQTASSPFEASLLGQLARIAPNAQIYNAYGLTEFYSWVSFKNITHAHQANLINLPEGSLLWDDTEGANPQEGVLFLKESSIVPHWQGIEDRLSWQEETYLGTGDVIQNTPEGYQILSRTDDRIAINAIKFYPQEVEAFYLKQLNLDSTYFVHLSELKLNILLVQGSEDQKLTEKIIDLSIQLQGIKRPQRVLYTENIPRSARGKVSRKELKKLCLHMLK